MGGGNININLDSAKDTLCKNILIYGYCKFENKGCAFNHHRPINLEQQDEETLTTQPQSSPPSQSQSTPNSHPPQHTATQPPQSSGANDSKRKFNLNTPSFQPGMANVTAKFSTLSPKLKDIPIFVPAQADENGFDEYHKKFNVSTPSFTPNNYTPDYAGTPPPSQQSQQSAPPSLNNPYLNPPSTSDFYRQQPSYPLQYHLYAPQPPPRLTIPLPPYETNVNHMFIDNELRESLHVKNEATLQSIPRSSLPERVHVYHSLVPIDKSYELTSKVWNVPLGIYKVFSNIDGNPYCLDRIDHGFDIVNETPFKHIKRWKSIKCPNVVQLQDAFTSMSFAESSQLVFVYDYFPNSHTLLEYHHKKIGRTEPITEDLLWSYLIQIVSAVQAIHEKGLAARSALNWRKVIVTSKGRIRLSGCGINDVLDYEHDEEQGQMMGLQNYRKSLQRADIKLIGKLLVELCCLTLPQTLRTQTDLAQTIRNISKSSTLQFSPEFIQILTILNQDSAEFDLNQFVSVHLSGHMLKSINGLQDSCDYMESQLSSEVENARLFRLLTKLNFIIDRPETDEWQENTNKYIIKLFRDYIFCQYDEYGKPVVDLSRVLTNLNKLDAGIDEKFLLISRDEKNCIIVSYKEIRDIVDTIFRNLTRN